MEEREGKGRRGEERGGKGRRGEKREKVKKEVNQRIRKQIDDEGERKLRLKSVSILS